MSGMREKVSDLFGRKQLDVLQMAERKADLFLQLEVRAEDGKAEGGDA